MPLLSTSYVIGPLYDCFHFKRKVVLLFGCLSRKIGNEFKNCVLVLLWLLLKCPLEVFTHVGLLKKKKKKTMTN